MNAEQWARLKAWFGEALEADPARRPEIVARARREAPDLAAELERLLAAHDAPGPPTLEMTALPDAWHERFPDGVPAGFEIANYRAVRELGRGGSGLVLLAERRDDEFHRPVALKLLRFRHADDDQLRRERGSLARMQHGNVATLLDWGTTADGVSWLATEFVEGLPLDEYCRVHSLGRDGVLELFAQVAAAVDYAHGRAVLHRDLKPGNILVNRAGAVKLLDFGIAQVTDSAADAAAPLRFTPGYASPEQRRGEPATAASDVYSLGVLLDRLLAAAPDAARRSPELAAVLARATATDPRARYASVAAFAADLVRSRRHLPPLEVPVSWVRRAGLFSRRQRPALTASAAALALLAVASGWWWQAGRSAAGPNLRPVPAMVFAQQALGRPSDALPLQIVLPQGGRVRSVAVLAQGVPNLDFTSSDAAACVGDFAPGAGCSLHIRFAPTAPGWRLGAVVLRGDRGRPVSTQFIVGRGAALEDWRPTPKPAAVYPGLDFARGLSTDGAGNAYFIEARGSSVDEIPADLAPKRILARLPLESGATAVDGAGDVYFSSSANHAVYRLADGAPVRVADLPSSSLLDNNLSVDGAGNLYASSLDGAIYMVAAGSRRVLLLYPPGRGHRFVAMASDLDGNLFCLDYNLNTLFELRLGSTQLVTVLPSDGQLSQPHALALFYSGDFLVGNDAPGGHVLRYPAGRPPALSLPIAGNQSLALFGLSRLFAVVNNNQVAVYDLHSVLNKNF